MELLDRIDQTMAIISNSDMSDEDMNFCTSTLNRVLLHIDNLETQIEYLEVENARLECEVILVEY
jgi:hypothetical protein